MNSRFITNMPNELLDKICKILNISIKSTDTRNTKINKILLSIKKIENEINSLESTLDLIKGLHYNQVKVAVYREPDKRILKIKKYHGLGNLEIKHEIARNNHILLKIFDLTTVNNMIENGIPVQLVKLGLTDNYINMIIKPLLIE